MPSKLRLAVGVGLLAVAIGVPAYLTTMFLGTIPGIIVAGSMAIGIGGGRWAMAQRQGGGQSTAQPRRRKRSKGARQRDR